MVPYHQFCSCRIVSIVIGLLFRWFGGRIVRWNVHHGCFGWTGGGGEMPATALETQEDEGEEKEESRIDKG